MRFLIAALAFALAGVAGFPAEGANETESHPAAQSACLPQQTMLRSHIAALEGRIAALESARDAPADAETMRRVRDLSERVMGKLFLLVRPAKDGAESP